MRDLEEQLADWSRALSEEVDPVDIDSVRAPTATAESRRPRVIVWSAVAASIALAGGIVAVTTLQNDDPARIVPVTDPGQTSVAPQPTTGSSEPLLIDTDAPIPAPESSVATEEEEEPVDRMADWPEPTELAPIEDVPRWAPSEPIPGTGLPVRGESPGTFLDQPVFTQLFVDESVGAQIVLSSSPGSPDSTQPARRIDVAGWDRVFRVNQGVLLTAQDPGGSVTVRGAGVSNEDAIEILASMERRPEGVPGWDLPSSYEGFVEVIGSWGEQPQRGLTWYEGIEIVAQLVTTTEARLVAGTIGAERVNIAGVEGWISSSGNTVVWSPDGTNTVILRLVDDRVDPVALAESVTEFNATDFEQRTTTEPPEGLGDGCNSLFC